MLRDVVGGALVWGALSLFRSIAKTADPSQDLAAIEAVLAGLLLVAAPALLAVSRGVTPARLVIAAGLGAAASFAAPPSWGVVLCLPWLLVGAVELGAAVRRWWSRPLDPTAGVWAVGRVFLLVGGGWLVFARGGGTLPGLSHETVRLAAVHSHATGFASLTLIGLAAQRASAGLLAKALAGCGVVLGLGFACTGIGIASLHLLEPVGAGLLVVALGGYAGLSLAQRWPAAARRLHLLSLLGLAVALGLGIARAARHLSAAEPLVDRPTMIAAHGLAALTFAVAGALAYALDAEARPLS